jgi:tyrosyl-tRNA synthetase
MDPSPAPGASTAAEVAAASVDPPAPDASSSAAAAAAEDLAGSMAGMTLDERFDLLMSIGEECIQPDELKRLLEKKPVPICYDGFEPSGRMHIAQVRRSSLLSPLVTLIRNCETWQWQHHHLGG